MKDELYDREKINLNVRIEEYKLAKQEQQNHFTRKEQMFNFSLAILSALMVASYTTVEHRPVVILFLTFGIPAVSFSLLFMWLSNARRIVKIGVQLRLMENEESAFSYFRMENFLRENKELNYEYAEYYAAICIYSGFPIVSTVSGFLILNSDLSQGTQFEIQQSYSSFVTWYGLAQFSFWFQISMVVLFLGVVLFAFIFGKRTKALTNADLKLRKNRAVQH